MQAQNTVGIGIDTVDIARFIAWRHKGEKSLGRILSPEEIDYCMAVPTKSAERFAVRFAAREALYKALQPILVKPIPFLTLCRATSISKSAYAEPTLSVCKKIMSVYIGDKRCDSLRFLISFTHSHCCATAFVMITDCQ